MITREHAVRRFETVSSCSVPEGLSFTERGALWALFVPGRTRRPRPVDRCTPLPCHSERSREICLFQPRWPDRVGCLYEFGKTLGGNDNMRLNTRSTIPNTIEQTGR